MFIARLNQNGSLDTSYHAGTTAAISSVCLQSNGKVLAAGNFGTADGSSRFYVVRFNTDGTLDNTFTTPGNVNTNTTTSMDVVVLQPNGQIIIAGSFSKRNGISQNCIARLNTDGSVDTSFYPTGAPSGGIVYGISILPSGKFIVIGSFSSWNGITVNGIARLLSNGRIDSTFSPGAGFSSTPMALYTQPDSKMVAVGQFTQYQGATTNYIVRFDTSGLRDTTYNIGSGLNNSKLYSVFGNYDGKAYAGGVYLQANGYSRINLCRFTANGAVDQSFFYNSGIVGTVDAFATQSTGKTIIGGTLTYFDSLPLHNILRLNANGNYDTSFHMGSGFNGQVVWLTMLPNDQVLVSGSFTTYNGTSVGPLIRLNSNGSLDNTFYSITTNNIIVSTTIDKSGNIYVAGISPRLMVLPAMERPS